MFDKHSLTMSSRSSRKDCSICCQTLADSKFIRCSYCNEDACRYCQQTYIKEQADDNCMFCKKRWNIEFMYANFTATFMKKDYKNLKTETLLHREKALLPETQKKMEITKKKRANTEIIMKLQVENGDIIHGKIHKLGKLYVKGLVTPEKYKEEVNKLKEICSSNLEKIEELRAINSVLDLETDEKTVERKEPVYPCSMENCRGFLSANGHSLKCGICQTQHCNQCRTKADDEHKCSKETLDTIKLLEKETKPCPKCHIPIYKTSGCDQMWCVKCHTAFSWNTGNVETGHIHNPHYWQYMQAQGRDLEEIRRMNRPREQGQCIELLDLARVTQSKKFFSICNLLSHLRYGEIMKYDINNYAVHNRDIREAFLQNIINEEKFKKEIYAREKRNWFNIEIRQIITMIYDTSKDLLANTYNNHYNVNDQQEYRGYLKDALAEINKILVYSFEEIKKISGKYGYVVASSFTISELIRYTDINTPL